MGLGELAHREDATEDHRLGRCVGERGELGDGPRSIPELTMRQRLGNGQLGAQDGHVRDRCGATNVGGHAEGVQRPPSQRLAQRPSPLERHATLRIAAQGDLGLAHLVGGIVPALRQRQLACDPVGREPAERILPARLPQIEHHLSIQRPALDPASGDDRRRRAHDVHAHADGSSFGLDRSTHHVNCSTSSTNRRRSTSRWHHAKSTIESTSLTATAAGIAAIVRLTVASRPLS